MRASNDSANLAIILTVTENGDISLIQCRRGLSLSSIGRKDRSVPFTWKHNGWVHSEQLAVNDH